MHVLVTGAAGFIGYHLSETLLKQGARVTGIDNINAYYDVTLKEARLRNLQKNAGFEFVKLDISDREPILALAPKLGDVTHVAHLAAQAGVRHSLTDPYTYVMSNVMGQVVLLELARLLPKLQHFVYASSSSVYGANTKLPFSIDDETERPNSLYAATKKSDELIGRTYAHLYGIKATGLRFFTVYGPWGRPDMAAFLFTKAILAGDPIRVFNNGEMWRDFTYIDDIIAGLIAALKHLPRTTPPHAVYNLGNHRSEKLTDFIATLERALGRKAQMKFEPMQPGDVASTFADIDASRRDLAFEPKTPISEGIPRFVEWYKSYYRVWPNN
ncbi:MAG: SDR family NAD(P)-dependent oxidoreductase [Alphaproteobacteria bacterium]|nr:SDR family NAD(P)-dependent oxidoreductase [Alphaproteobacteria bacterium]